MAKMKTETDSIRRDGFLVIVNLRKRLSKIIGKCVSGSSRNHLAGCFYKEMDAKSRRVVSEECHSSDFA
jgi:hypothetical protein